MDLIVELSGLPLNPLARATYTLTYTVKNASGANVTDLSYFQEAAGHIAVVRQDLNFMEHLHAYPGAVAMSHSGGHRRGVDSRTRFGPSMASEIIFGFEGWYLLVLQFARGENLCILCCPV